MISQVLFKLVNEIDRLFGLGFYVFAEAPISETELSPERIDYAVAA
jgi:hypothetical protein